MNGESRPDMCCSMLTDSDEYIPSQLLMINHDRLAQYWMPFGHISFYERVDINALIVDTFGQSASDPEAPTLKEDKTATR